MAKTRVIILEGPNGQSFFLKETLLAENLADRVHVVRQAQQAIDLLQVLPYDLIIINLVEAWEQGLKLSAWLSQFPATCSTILIIPSDLDRPLPTNGSFIILSEPLSLRDFASKARLVLQPNNSEGMEAKHPTMFDLPGMPGWTGEPLEQEYSGYWSPYVHSLLA
jgi:hypothetical protein